MSNIHGQYYLVTTSPLRLKERVLHLDVAELKKAAAATVHKDAADVSNFSKLAEGGFNRVFEMTIDGIPVLARLPYPADVSKTPHHCQ
jgi:hypothetical protein